MAADSTDTNRSVATGSNSVPSLYHGVRIVEQDDAGYGTWLFCDAVKKGDHVITHGMLFFDFPDQFAILVERPEDIDTLSVYARFRTPRLPDRRLSILHRRVRTESRFVEI